MLNFPILNEYEWTSSLILWQWDLSLSRSDHFLANRSLITGTTSVKSFIHSYILFSLSVSVSLFNQTTQLHTNILYSHIWHARAFTLIWEYHHLPTDRPEDPSVAHWHQRIFDYGWHRIFFTHIPMVFSDLFLNWYMCVEHLDQTNKQTEGDDDLISMFVVRIWFSLHRPSMRTRAHLLFISSSFSCTYWLVTAIHHLSLSLSLVLSIIPWKLPDVFPHLRVVFLLSFH